MGQGRRKESNKRVLYGAVTSVYGVILIAHPHISLQRSV